MPPHSLTMTGIGTGLLWVGWFGFNAGSALEANGSAALAMMNTFVATAAAGLSWMVAERLNGHKASALGFCSGIVAGLVAVTPAAGNSGPFGAIVLRSEEHTSELQSLMRISYAVFCLKKKK